MTHVKPITVGTNYCLQLTLFAYIRNIDEHIIAEPGKCIETFFFFPLNSVEAMGRIPDSIEPVGRGIFSLAAFLWVVLTSNS